MRNRIEQINTDPKLTGLVLAILTDYLSQCQDKPAEAVDLNQIVADHLPRRGPRPAEYKPDVINGILLTCRLDPEVFVMFHQCLNNLTGKTWPTDEAIHMLVTWFIYKYQDLTRIPPRSPFELRTIRPRSNRLLEKFNTKFGRFYKNKLIHWPDGPNRLDLPR